MGYRPGQIQRVVRREDRVPYSRRRDARAERGWILAQSGQDDRRIIPHEGSAHRLALGRTLLCAEACGLRSRGQQWKLAVVRVDRLRCAAIFSDFQSLAAAETVRS